MGGVLISGEYVFRGGVLISGSTYFGWGVLILGGMYIWVLIIGRRELKLFVGSYYFRTRTNLRAFAVPRLRYSALVFRHMPLVITVNVLVIVRAGAILGDDTAVSQLASLSRVVVLLCGECMVAWTIRYLIDGFGSLETN